MKQIVEAFRLQRKVPELKSVFLMFDGEQLDFDGVMRDTEIEDMDNIEVHVSD